MASLSRWHHCQADDNIELELELEGGGGQNVIISMENTSQQCYFEREKKKPFEPFGSSKTDRVSRFTS